VQLAIVLAVVLPLLPVEALDPWGVLSPRKIGLFIVLIAGVGYVGYVLHRLLGPSRGAVVGGLVGGLVSSTAVTVAMAQQSRTDERMVLPGQVAVAAGERVMLARVLVITALIDREIAASLAPPARIDGRRAAGGARPQAAGARGGSQSTSPRRRPLTNPFALVPALRWGVVLSIVLIASAAAREQFGERGLLVAAAASGLADVDAVTSRSAASTIRATSPPPPRAWPSRSRVVANSLVKATIAVIVGRRGFGRPIAAVLATAIAAGTLVAWTLR
jgi:uncharacterized membrane protein (DUF4010 family)